MIVNIQNVIALRNFDSKHLFKTFRSLHFVFKKVNVCNKVYIRLKNKFEEMKVNRTLNNNIYHALTLNALPSVNLHFPPDGLARMFLQLLHAMTDWAWLKTTEVSLHPPHLTSMK